MIAVIALFVCALTSVIYLSIHNYSHALDNTPVVFIISLAGQLVALFGVLATFIEPFISDRLYATQKNAEKKDALQVDLSIELKEDNYVLFTALAKNNGDNNMSVTTANIYIERGLEKNIYDNSGNLCAVKAEFPFILELEKNNSGKCTKPCHLCVACLENDNKYPDHILDKRFQNLFRTCIEMRHLTTVSVQMIGPTETFTEDSLMQITNAGVYRATFITLYESAPFCSCAVKEFYIANNTN